jgi:sugar phosphate isomerase/epimerase
VRTIDLTYCTNVHDLATPESWRAALSFFGPAVRQHLGWTEMPLGLWWQAPLAEAAARDPGDVGRFLREHGLRAFTCNAFPYGNFHEPVVKTKVYHPDWSTPERLLYTQRCADTLAALVPEGGFGTLSTLPLGWRLEWGSEKTTRAVEHLFAWVDFAAALERRTGRRLALALEAEPGCILERTPQVRAFWTDVLRPAAARSGREATLPRHLGLCYDTCHQAVQFESPEEALDSLRRDGIPVHKMQLSSGLEFVSDAARTSLAARRAFAEPKFLHQTRAKGEAGVADYDDLPEALDRADWSRPWRTHFHLPLQAETLLGDAVRTTREDMLRAYRFALAHDLCRHFEVETYTWSVMPEQERPSGPEALAAAMAREIAFVVDHTPADVVIAGRPDRG